MNIQAMTTDKLIERLYWIADRAAYWRACNIPQPGTLYADDCRAEIEIFAELQRRGVASW